MSFSYINTKKFPSEIKLFPDYSVYISRNQTNRFIKETVERRDLLQFLNVEGIKVNKQGRHYVSNPYLFREMLKSKELDLLTDDAIKMFLLMIDNISSKKMYNDENLREDCKAGAMMDVLLYWRSFNPEKYDNPFAYFTSIIINGMTKVFNAYMKGAKSYETISLDNNIHSL